MSNAEFEMFGVNACEDISIYRSSHPPKTSVFSPNSRNKPVIQKCSMMGECHHAVSQSRTPT